MYMTTMSLRYIQLDVGPSKTQVLVRTGFLVGEWSEGSGLLSHRPCEFAGNRETNNISINPACWASGCKDVAGRHGTLSRP